MSTNFISAQSAQNNAQSNNGLIMPVYHYEEKTRRFFIYGVEDKDEAARTINDYMSKKGVRFKPALVGDIYGPMESDYVAHLEEVKRLINHPEEIDDGTGEPGKVNYLEENFLVHVLRHITLDISVQKPKVLEYQSYTMIFGHGREEFWAAESFAASMAREVLIREHLLDRVSGEKDHLELLKQLKDAQFGDTRAKGLWLPTEMFLDSSGNLDINSRDRIFKDLITKDPWENLPLIHHTVAAIFSQKKVVKRMNFREFWRFLVAYLQPLMPSWLAEFKLYCIDFKDADIEFYMYRRLDSDVDSSLQGGFLDLGMTSDEADSVIKQYAAEHIGKVTVIDYTRDSDYDPYVQADKFVDFLQKATGAEGIKDGVEGEGETNFMKVIYFFLWLVREIPNLEKDNLQEMAKGLKVGQVAKFLWNHPSMVDFPVISLVEFISRVKFLGAWCQLWYDLNHHNPSSHYSEYPELPCISFAGDFRGTLKNFFNV